MTNSTGIGGTYNIDLSKAEVGKINYKDSTLGVKEDIDDLIKEIRIQKFMDCDFKELNTSSRNMLMIRNLKHKYAPENDFEKGIRLITSFIANNNEIPMFLDDQYFSIYQFLETRQDKIKSMTREELIKKHLLGLEEHLFRTKFDDDLVQTLKVDTIQDPSVKEFMNSVITFSQKCYALNDKINDKIKGSEKEVVDKLETVLHLILELRYLYVMRCLSDLLREKDLRNTLKTTSELELPPSVRYYFKIMASMST